MDKVLSLFLRRMRAPLLALTAAYSISVTGLVLIPGIDDQGEPWRMDFFHAFYFVSYMATTIGFGEIPHAFSEAQRMWTTVTVYLSVIAWLYAIGKILTLVQDPTFKLAVSQQTFDRSIRRLREPFFIVCGYGDTGSLLVRALLRRRKRVVVIDRNPDCLNDLALSDTDIFVPGLIADASVSARLQSAGLSNPLCQGVVALTDSDEANLKIAITVKLLNPMLPVICRAESADTERNMQSFGTDQVINPFHTFGDRLALALHSPAHHLLHQWLSSVPGSNLPMPLYPPRGRWILCGFGRFGKAVHAGLSGEQVEVVVVEADPEGTGCAEDCVQGRGTEAETLREAGVASAAGIVAGTNSDTNNLSILMTARDLSPELFMVGRQNSDGNGALFAAAELDLVMRHSETIAEAILSHLTSPLLPLFLRRSRDQDSDWANELISRIGAVTGERVPAVWAVRLDRDTAPALLERLRTAPVTLGELLSHPHQRERRLPCLALMLRRGADRQPLLAPQDSETLGEDDEILFCGRGESAARIARELQDPHALEFLLTGRDRPQGWLWRRLGSTPRPGAGGTLPPS
ncbi:potassium channel family protein [Thioalkalivibrio paradoxus]|uniref:Potassium transporter TrkA n=1 Tax=Thioalkalivibrio paradoxus ARh 1 TaxID=713585 RepID=W0DP28_9GAMM|nr:potassium channel family protein [Thioalkalivibrio paradoxus]AHE98738.1 potassium transporter TrkA [Thioalkalivibrio paradoxus ARh 1]